MLPNLNIRTKVLHLHLASDGSLASMARLAAFEEGARITSAMGAQRFTLSHDDQIVTDHKTGIMWPVYESENEMDADDLAKYVAAFRLGAFDDWFTPSVDQRESIRDLSRYAPALFPPLKSRKNGWEWTCTPVASAGKTAAGVPAALWQVRGHGGHLHTDYRDYKAFARPCRFVARAGQ